ncbi:DNA methylase [Vibrio phage helene 12B3]|uniref:DNA methylase n=1 Tax=Vibrio phage helene 12B3 TaxID=573173 RepID=UPI0002C14C9A|nr:DNA methylase [Vibrio phage helene 12B3]AGG57788.1 DNA methylase [Vibrio phage helene 12B3]
MMKGDCLEVMKGIPDGSIDMILTDPPYGTTRNKWDSVIPLDAMWEQLKRIIKPKGVIVLMAQTPFDKVLGASNISMLKYEWIWEKTAATGHLNAKKMPMKAHENALVFSDDPEDHWNMMVFYKSLPAYNPQITEGHKPTNSYTKRDDSDGECYGKTRSVSGGGKTSRYPRSVQVFASDKQKCKLHPTQKPVALMEYLIKTYTNEGETVLDFTMGSGTTGVAAKNLNRGFIGIELDDQYFEIAKDRIEKA